jgi:acetolactate synthase-1/2/3 large subunit
MDGLLKQDGPLLLNVIVDPRQEFVPRIKSRVDENGKFITPELDDMHPFLERAELQSVAKSALAIRATA